MLVPTNTFIANVPFTMPRPLRPWLTFARSLKRGGRRKQLKRARSKICPKGRFCDRASGPELEARWKEKAITVFLKNRRSNIFVMNISSIYFRLKTFAKYCRHTYFYEIPSSDFLRRIFFRHFFVEYFRRKYFIEYFSNIVS